MQQVNHSKLRLLKKAKTLMFERREERIWRRWNLQRSIMMNKCIFYGNLARDPEVFQTQNGEKLVRITVATHRIVNGEKRTEFIPCLAFRKNAELLEQYYQKGRPILIEARVVNSKGRTKNGEEYNTFSFIIERFEFAGSGRKEQQHEQTISVQPAESEIPEDELEKELEEFFEEDESFEPPVESDLPF